MTALPVAFYLKELSGEPSRRRGVPQGETASDIELQVSEAHARGILEARAEAQVELDVALAKQAAEFESRLAAEREAWVAEQGSRLAQLVAAQLEDIEQRISQRVSLVLQPFIGEEIRDKAVRELSEVLDGMLAKGDYAKISVSGPQDLVAAMETRLGGSHPGISFLPGEAVDVVVVADETILETRIGAWVAAIEGDHA